MFEIVKALEKYNSLVAQLQQMFPDDNKDGVPDVVSAFLSKFNKVAADWAELQKSLAELQTLATEVTVAVEHVLGVRGNPDQTSPAALPPVPPPKSPAQLVSEASDVKSSAPKVASVSKKGDKANA